MCEPLNDGEKENVHLLETQLVIEKIEQSNAYEQILKRQNIIINNLHTENNDLKLKIFNGKIIL